MKNIRTVVIFPGQGSQYPGMSRILRSEFPWANMIFEEASDVLREDTLHLCENGTKEDLQITRNAQPAILTTSYAWWQVLKRELDLQVVAAAGHSLGEYTALLSQDAITFAEAVSLVRRRGDLMQNAVPIGQGKMAAILGLEDSVVKALCERASQADSLVVPANFNSPGQVVIAGHSDAVDRAQQIAKEDPTINARRIIPLTVSAPFHSPLMKSIAHTFGDNLRAVKWKNWLHPIAFNVDGIMRSEGDVIQLLTQQLDHPVQWTSCVKSLEAGQNTLFVEVGPGQVLTGLVKRIADSSTAISIDSLDALKRLEESICKEKLP